MPNPNHADNSAEVSESLHQFTSMWKVFVEERENADTVDRPGLAVRWADDPFPFWNMIFLTERDLGAQHLAERLEQAASYMRASSHAGFVSVWQDRLDDTARAGLPDAASRAGLKFARTMRGMVAGDIRPIPEPAHPSLRFVRVRTEDQRRAFGEINGLANGLTAEAGRAGLDATCSKDDRYCYLGLEGDEPVCAGATVANAGCLFLTMVATLPGAERKGFGEAVTRKALVDGARATGLTRTVLHATDAGFPVYRRIGYREVATIRFYGLGP